LWAVLVLLAPALLASCGGGSGSSSSTTVGPTSTSTSAGSTSTTVARRGDLAIADAETTVRPAVVTDPARSVEGSIRTADGRERTYRAYVPEAVATAGEPVPLLIALHGGLGWGAQFERNSGFDGLAEANGFVVVYPDGWNAGTDARQVRTWNAGRCCGPAARLDVDDVGFIDELIDHLAADLPVDPDQVVVAGHSNGGMLALRLGCDLADRIVAIGLQSSALEAEGCEPARPVSLLQIHGDADRNVPIEGGEGEQAVSQVAYEPPRGAAEAFARTDGCESPEDRAAPSNPDLTATVWARCDDGSEVAFLTVAGASHAWMGHPSGGSGLTGPPYEDLDSSLVIWDFLSRQLAR
jgi:polyhydroxybutyrate depolymerase